ncbi:MAG: spore coat protein [Clostridia bacterium]|nr:spore coat protein [Clostridia bacterium]
MDEKTMVNDILVSMKSGLITYQEIINETENIELRQVLQQTRNVDESFEYELFKVAQIKGYYKTSLPANNKDVQKIKLEFE